MTGNITTVPSYEREPREPANIRCSPPTGRSHEEGTTVVLVSIVMLLILIMAAFAVDVGFWFSVANHSQRTADIAALAAVQTLVEEEQLAGDRAAAEAAGSNAARQAMLSNGVDLSNPNTTATIVFGTEPDGSDSATVSITHDDIDMFFAGLVLDNVTIGRDATATMSDCQAECTSTILVASSLANMVDSGTGGDGWRPTLAGDQVFNLFHHGVGDVLSCVDTTTESLCEVGGDPDFYPLEPYPGIETNYTPKVAAIDTDVYFVVQTSTRVGLGCWDGDTHSPCAGFGTPRWLENYSPNSGTAGNVRIDGPEVVGDRLFMYGDNNFMYCVDGPSATVCPGYPQSTPLAGVHDMDLVDAAAGFAGGVEIDDLQFDMEPTPTGDKIFTALNPVPGAVDQTWIGCWDTVSDSPCSGFSPGSTEDGRTFLFLTYTTAGDVDGVCARAGHRGGGSGVGHQCFDLTGAPVASPLSFDFDVGVNTPTQQSATGQTSSGHVRTFFPYRGNNSSRCWDWTIANECNISSSNWSSEGTEDYAYIYDGGRCMYGLGHAGLLWTFDIDTGQWPCPGDARGEGSIFPCSCADGVNLRWTSLAVTEETDLDLFASFAVTVSFPDGTVFASVDLTTVERAVVDLRPLNSIAPFPAEMTVLIEVEAHAGQEDVALAAHLEVGLQQVSGVRPVLVR